MPASTTSTDRLLLKVPEAAQVLGIGASTVNRLIRQGRLRALKIDRSTRISRTELEDFVKRGGQASQAAA